MQRVSFRLALRVLELGEETLARFLRHCFHEARELHITKGKCVNWEITRITPGITEAK